MTPEPEHFKDRSERDDGRLHEAVGAFASAAHLEAAIAELTSAGWDRADLSLLAQKTLFDPTVPTGEADMRRAADNPHAPHAAVVSETDVRQGRTLAASLAGVIAGFVATGATILTGGGMLAALVGAAAAGGGATMMIRVLGQIAGGSRIAFLNEQVDRGGILLWVRLPDPDREALACDILKRHGGAGVHVTAGV